MTTTPRPQVHGLSLTPLTQCLHYHTPLDILAIKHACCQKFYACITCHNACETDHAPAVWRRDQREEKAVLCGACGTVGSVREYMEGGSRCAACGRGFNPGCRAHWGRYFEVGGEGEEQGR
ncbi:zinc finger CHY domain-containing protein [Dothidotthia symphoricarpi CBS 119687]|uniref:Zinc finger CHY domain-containing protein n=1 Tax=Dothidotthia symphoricarpi CBS 119687 TaxID=1392245 RepID=A0A6A6A5E7_9PLEO|nr:zinc finger CHY domain-containing protein [Dothidotthia symphoricarpi CBS 119687]KAF2126385.1 zinc finger CHY domain-containing protein [Dothidotthia symphoricarpi CBS 119687]